MIDRRRMMGVEKELPIMSFQTDIDGTFAPTILPQNGTLKWVVDGVEQITNAPSYTLTGLTVDVEVFANDVVLGESISVSMDSQNIIGSLSFEYFTINGLLAARLNPNLTGVKFSTFNNVISSLCRLNGCGINTVIDFTKVTFSDSSLECDNNPNMPTPIFATSGSTLADVDFNNTGISTLNLGFAVVNGSLDFGSSPNLTSLIFSAGNNVLTGLLGVNGNITGVLDLTNVSISNEIRVSGNSNLTGFIFGTNNGNLTVAQFFNNNITGVFDVSSFTINAQMIYYGNPNLTQLISSSSGNSSSLFRGYNNYGYTGTLDLSGWTMTQTIDVDDNYGMTNIIAPTFTTGFTFYDITRSGFSQSGVDDVFVSVRDFFNVNTPIKNLTINTNGGTNSTPSATGLQAIIDLESIYLAAGFTFTHTIN